MQNAEKEFSNQEPRELYEQGIGWWNNGMSASTVAVIIVNKVFMTQKRISIKYTPRKHLSKTVLTK